ncbi:hypothetical protein FB558_5949 [Pseudonocardia kunmingensis]|uniref:Uncharacterized protein n=1 Tax=Pseudonocardia kunmingensis TaxID=630975 RepID=A0A543DLN2_9PSEU|nr:hypothetical protein FB558_5949 [Pseudonocardia kunmingensis]
MRGQVDLCAVLARLDGRHVHLTMQNLLWARRARLATTASRAGRGLRPDRPLLLAPPVGEMVEWAELPNDVVAVTAVPDCAARPPGTRPFPLGATRPAVVPVRPFIHAIRTILAVMGQ